MASLDGPGIQMFLGVDCIKGALRSRVHRTNKNLEDLVLDRFPAYQLQMVQFGLGNRFPRLSGISEQRLADQTKRATASRRLVGQLVDEKSYGVSTAASENCHIHRETKIDMNKNQSPRSIIIPFVWSTSLCSEIPLRRGNLFPRPHSTICN